jgi:hypothetical protein
VSVAGTEESPEVEIFVAFGGTIRVAGHHARWLLEFLDQNPMIERPDEQ